MRAFTDRVFNGTIRDHYLTVHSIIMVFRYTVLDDGILRFVRELKKSGGCTVHNVAFVGNV